MHPIAGFSEGGLTQVLYLNRWLSLAFGNAGWWADLSASLSAIALAMVETSATADGLMPSAVL
jgi:hypothetical protein